LPPDDGIFKSGPRPECQDGPTAVEIGAPRLGSSEIAFIKAHSEMKSKDSVLRLDFDRWLMLQFRARTAGQGMG
jgi:hypothetical protein